MTTPEKFAAARALFPHTHDTVYFNSASYGPMPTSVRDAVIANLDERVIARHDDTHQAFGTAEELRADFAVLIGAQKREIGLGLGTTFGLNLAAFGLPLTPGDEVLVPDHEFPAAVYVWRAAAAQRGLTLRFVPTRDGCFHVDLLEAAITPRTRVVTCSFVQFFNGFAPDLTAISALCRKHDIFLVIDGIQGMGVQPIDVAALGIDVFATGCQKWMLSPQGGGFFYLSDRVRDRLLYSHQSWQSVDWQVKYTDLFHYDKPWFDSARRFEMGYYAVSNLLGMKAAVKIFQELTIPAIAAHNRRLIDRLADYVRKNAYYRITSMLEPKHRSSIVTFTCSDIKALHRKLVDSGFILSLREGSIRVSVHLFNNEADIDRLIERLDEHSCQQGSARPAGSPHARG